MEPERLTKPGEKAAFLRKAIFVEWLTAAWLAVETIVAICSGIAAHSVSLMTFGADSIIELLSAGVLLWRLTIELERGEESSKATEALASKIAGLLLFALAAFVVVVSAWVLWYRQGQEFSMAGVAIAIVAIPVMIVLARIKRGLADSINSSALRADAAESVACAYLSGVVVIGLAAQWLLGAWWIDGITALCIVPFLIHEGREALEGNEEEED